MDWVRDFYSRTGTWWGEAEARVTDRDHERARLVNEYAGAGGRVLELGSGYGATAVALAQRGYTVTCVEISDRADFTDGLSAGLAAGAVTVHRGDFHTVEVDGRFDAVCYWNGFGVGSDEDQRRLLTRIAARWLRPGAPALIDVFNPFVWAGWDGDESRRDADPAAGYHHELRELTSFDPVTCTAVDTWWEPEHPDRTFSQHLRCYSPADLALLLTGTGLSLTGIVVAGHELPLTPHPGLSELLRSEHEYLAILRPEADRT